MNRRTAMITLFILILVVVIAAWSRLRYVGQDGYDNPQRWPIGEHPTLGDENRRGGAR